MNHIGKEARRKKKDAAGLTILAIGLLKVAFG